MDSDLEPKSVTQTLADVSATELPEGPSSSPDLLPPPATTLDEVSPYSVGNELVLETSCPGNSSEPVEVEDHSEKQLSAQKSDSPEQYVPGRWSPSYNQEPWGRPGDQVNWNFQVSSSATEIRPTGVGAGLRNLGNTCFLNAILQCFTHTVLLVQGLCDLNHVRKLCQRGKEGFCILCFLCGHIGDSLSSSGRTIEPVDLVDNLSNISSCFGRYQQEDAHEFLQCLLDKLETCCLDCKTNDDTSSQKNNLVKRVFGGRLISKLRCCNCSYFSDTYEPIIDLSLEIGDVDSLPGALESFTKVERIEDTDMNFTCENCKEKVAVEKQLILDEPPAIAAFHLKRFKADGSYVVKIDKHVKYPLELDLNPYASGSHNNDDGLKYELYAVVVHVGPTPSSGHYFCFVRSSPDTWHRLDDSKVYGVSEDFVLSQDAYILLYARQGTMWFSTLMESHKTLLEPTIVDKSPKSVLDLQENTLCPSTVNNNSCKDSKMLDVPNRFSTIQHFPRADVEVQMRDAPAGVSSSRCESANNNVTIGGAEEIPANLSSGARQEQGLPRNESRSDVCITDTPAACGGKTSSIYEKTGTPSNAGNFNINDLFHIITPPASPSPVRSYERSHKVPEKHLRSEERPTCKRQLSRDLDDSKKGEERKEAVRYLSKYKGSCSRREMLLAAAMGGNEEVSRKKRTKVSPPAKDNHPQKSRQRTVVGS